MAAHAAERLAAKLRWELYCRFGIGGEYRDAEEIVCAVFGQLVNLQPSMCKHEGCKITRT